MVARLPEAVRVDIEAWGGEPTFRVRGKNFVFSATDASALSVKLPKEEAEAVVATDPAVEPTSYGLGRHGWISVRVLGLQPRPEPRPRLHRPVRAGPRPLHLRRREPPGRRVLGGHLRLLPAAGGQGRGGGRRVDHQAAVVRRQGRHDRQELPGITQLFVAAEDPDGLEAIAPGHFFANAYRDVANPGGIPTTASPCYGASLPIPATRCRTARSTSWRVTTAAQTVAPARCVAWARTPTSS